MATISKVRRLVNPGRKKRKLSALQKLFFGSKRQRAAVKNKGKRKRTTLGHKVVRRRKRNVGSIITVWPKAKSNPGKRYVRRKKSNRGKKVIIVNSGEKMATRKRRVHRRRRVVATVTRRRRRNYGTKVGRSWSAYAKRSGRKRNPGRRRVVNYRRRRSNPGRRHVRRVHHRRNPGMLTGTAGRVLGVIGGVAVTKLLCGFLPAGMSTGILGYGATAAIAVLQGKLVGKFSKSTALGNDMLVGGLAYLTAKILNDIFPSIGGYTGISGMGLIGPSSFYTPQVNQMGNMGAFQVPQAVRGYVAGAIPVAAPRGMGTMRRTGRL